MQCIILCYAVNWVIHNQLKTVGAPQAKLQNWTSSASGVAVEQLLEDQGLGMDARKETNNMEVAKQPQKNEPIDWSRVLEMLVNRLPYLNIL